MKDQKIWAFEYDKYQIPFTQFVRPNGLKRLTFFLTSDQTVYNKAQYILSRGLVFEVEELGEGTISATISNALGDLSIVLSTNGPSVVEKVEKMILEFNVEEYLDESADP